MEHPYLPQFFIFTVTKCIPTLSALYYYLSPVVLTLAEMELVFPTAAFIVLCSILVATKVLITCQCFGYWWAVLPQHWGFGCLVYTNSRKHHPRQFITLGLALVHPASTVGLTAMQRRYWHQGICFLVQVIVIKRLLHRRGPEMRTRSTMTASFLFPKGYMSACPALTLLFLQWKHNRGLLFAGSCLIWICLAWSLVQST